MISKIISSAEIPYDGSPEDAEAQLFEHMMQAGLPPGIAAEMAAEAKEAAQEARDEFETRERLHREVWWWRTLAIGATAAWLSLIAVTIALHYWHIL